MTVFVIDDRAQRELAALKERAEANPISYDEMLKMARAFEAGKPYTVIPADQTIVLMMGWTVTFTHEHHPGGKARHMSMASPNRERVPIPPAIEMVMEHLGYTTSLNQCSTWLEPLSEGHAVNVLEIFEPSRTRD